MISDIVMEQNVYLLQSVRLKGYFHPTPAFSYRIQRESPERFVAINLNLFFLWLVTVKNSFSFSPEMKLTSQLRNKPENHARSSYGLALTF